MKCFLAYWYLKFKAAVGLLRNDTESMNSAVREFCRVGTMHQFCADPDTTKYWEHMVADFKEDMGKSGTPRFKHLSNQTEIGLISCRRYACQGPGRTRLRVQANGS